MKIAYICSNYPAISHTFVLREVEALRARGVEVSTFSIHRSAADQLLSDADRQA
ncbi:MAG: colanic acid biosynthesis glycosyltransferase WcaL, partial [Actinobacteria bacterium]|nr:colanic acid biosynthesis glycosyltransferase WcaL [Actinomycetota bacterium]